MTNEEVIEKLVELRHMHERRVFCAISDETDEALGMAIAALEKAETNCPEIPDSWIPVTEKSKKGVVIRCR